jgi:molybdopterin-guanine dinucleotide biosynthesis protein A
MGADKARLEIDGEPLLERAVRLVGAACGTATVIGPPDRYPGSTPDLRPGLGPLAGIETALSLDRAEWSLVVAVDMPGLDTDTLARLARSAAHSPADCVLAVGARGLPEPLLAAYRRTCLGPVRRALDAGVRKVAAALEGLQVAHFQVDNQDSVANVNTPEEWAAWRGSRRG